MTKYRIKKCESPYRTWYEVQFKDWWWPFWNTWADSYGLLKYPTEREARYAISSEKKNKEKHVVTVSYIKDV